MPGQQGGLQAAWYRGDTWLWLLRPLEWLFRLLTALRRGLYTVGALPAFRAQKPVVIVGNVTVGGTGKTPVVIALVESLADRGLRAGVVSRGYGATAPSYPHLVSADSEAAHCGDEPLLIHRRTGAPCVVDPDRPRAVKTLLQQFPVDLVISDDGLQHYALHRDMEIAVVDAGRLLGNGFCLPAGPLREPESRLRRVDHVLYRGSDDPKRGVLYQPRTWVNLETGEQRELSAFALREGVFAIAGIGQPSQFFAILDELEIPYQSRVFADHHAYTRADFAALSGHTVLMTEKDAVKCRTLAGQDAWFLRIDAHLPGEVVDAVAALASS